VGVRASGGRDRLVSVRIGRPLTAVQRLCAAMALFAVDADLDLRDLRVRRAGRTAARRAPLRPSRPAPSADCCVGDAHAVLGAVYRRRLDSVAVRSSGRAGDCDRSGGQYGQRRAPRPTPAPRPSKSRPDKWRRQCDRSRPRVPRIVESRSGRRGSSGHSLRRRAGAVRGGPGRRILDARAGA
jgi:hypothetical protein